MHPYHKLGPDPYLFDIRIQQVKLSYKNHDFYLIFKMIGKYRTIDKIGTVPVPTVPTFLVENKKFPSKFFVMAFFYLDPDPYCTKSWICTYIFDEICLRIKCQICVD